MTTGVLNKTPVGSLGGDVSVEVLDSVSAPRGDLTNQTSIASLGRRTVSTWVIPFLSAKNKVKFNVQIRISMGQNASAVAIYIRRDNPDTGTIIASSSVTGGTGTRTLTGTDENAGSGGSVTYYYTVDVTNYAGSSLLYDNYDINPNGYVIYSSVDDTHVGSALKSTESIKG